MCVSLANLEGEETFDTSLLGQAETVATERVCDDELILIKGSVHIPSDLRTVSNTAVEKDENSLICSQCVCSQK